MAYICSRRREKRKLLAMLRYRVVVAGFCVKSACVGAFVVTTA